MAPLSEAKRATYHHGALKQALLDAASTLIAERGPEGFSLLDAARACGVAASAPYKHFPDKAALLRAVAERGAGLLAEGLQAAWAAQSVGKLRAFAGMGVAYLRFAREHPGEYAAMFATHSEAAWRQGGGPLGEALAALAPQGAEARALQGQIWAISHGAAMLERSGMIAPEQADEIVRDGVERLLRG